MDLRLVVPHFCGAENPRIKQELQMERISIIGHKKSCSSSTSGTTLLDICHIDPPLNWSAVHQHKRSSPVAKMHVRLGTKALAIGS